MIESIKPSAFIVNNIDPKTIKKYSLLPVGSVYEYNEVWEGYKCDNDEVNRVHVLYPSHAFDLFNHGILGLHISNEEMLELYKAYKVFLSEEHTHFLDEIEDFEFDKQKDYNQIERTVKLLKKYTEENE